MVYPILHGIIVSDPSVFIQQNLTHILWPHQQSFSFQQWLGKNAGPTSSFEISSIHKYLRLEPLPWLGWFRWGRKHSSIQSATTAENCSLFFEQNTNEMNVNRPAKILDVGSAVGRLSIEMLRKYTSNHVMLSWNRHRLLNGCTGSKDHSREAIWICKRSIGMTYKWQSIDVSFEHMQQVDFLGYRALCIPFDIEVSIMWLVVMFWVCGWPCPTSQRELERIQSKRGLISLLCPYDWSGNINTSDKWIGGQIKWGPQRRYRSNVAMVALSTIANFYIEKLQNI